MAGSGLTFHKMHGAGNDFVVLDSRARTGSVVTAALARRLGDRHRGVGFDQLAEIRSASDADFALDFWNADGGRAGACGNATRCVAGMLMQADDRDRMRIRTASGVLEAVRTDGRVWVNMGAPLLDWAGIPLARACDTLHLPLDVDAAGVGLGNPHCVCFTADADVAQAATLGPALENEPLFPERANVGFASLAGPDRLRLRVWERGTGLTLACGSGACAAAVAAHRRGMTGPRVRIDADGGVLQTDWRDDGIWLSGPVAHVFTGQLAPELGP